MELIKIKDCSIQTKQKTYLKEPLLQNISWTFCSGEFWLITGALGQGKEDFIKTLCCKNGECFFAPKENVFNSFLPQVQIVSLESAAHLIQEERQNDESDYTEGGVDYGRSAKAYIMEVLPPEYEKRLASLPQVRLCGVEKILDRGLKYMSTGEIRRVILCRALLSNQKLLILAQPFAGLDVQSKEILRDFFSSIGKRSTNGLPAIILCTERYSDIPQGITNVLEFSQKKISFCGTKQDYESFLKKRDTATKDEIQKKRCKFINDLKALYTNVHFTQEPQEDDTPLVSMHNVNVSWGGHQVLKNLSWQLYKGQHWLIKGPNGSGKTTLLELITGDNGQVYCNDVYLFGKKRGSGETIWDIKKRLGIVSYRLHVEYRMLGSCDLEAVVLSGLYDSIGLYEPRISSQQLLAQKWLELAGFGGKENASFSSLSYGEQRAVLILRSAIKCPSIMILDEPCHGVDENYRQKILDLIQTVALSGTTTILHVTHDITEVLPCEKHVLELLPDKEPMYKTYQR